jgi:uncharacterized protein YccT (UPF0319 family)
MTEEKKEGSVSLGAMVALPTVQLVKVLQVFTAALVQHGVVDGPRFSRQLLTGARKLRKKEEDQVMFNVLDDLAWISRAGGKRRRRTPKR